MRAPAVTLLSHRSPALRAAAIAGLLLLSACGGGGEPAETRSALGAEPIDAQAQARAKPVVVSTVSVSTPGWSTWTKRLKPVFSGPYSLIGDASVVREGNQLRMVYNCFDPVRQRGAVCQARSSDGISWADAPINDGLAGRLIQTRPGEWDDAHETPLLYKRGSEWLLYFSGYVDKGGFVNSFPAYLGLATSTDGLNFKRHGSEPVLLPSPGGHDNDAIFSPSITEHEGQLVMIYTGHCWTRCDKGYGVTLLAATSSDGRTWTKRPEPILTQADLPWTENGAAEASIVRGPDGWYYLFMSYLYGENGHDIGLARARTPYGPWDINPSPIVRRSAGEFDAKGPIAPTVLIENGKARMWFHGFGSDQTIRIGYAEAPWPLRLP